MGDFLFKKSLKSKFSRPSKQRRVRTRKPMDTDGSIDDGDKEKKAMKIINPAAATPSKMFRVQGERVISKALAERQYHVKLVGAYMEKLQSFMGILRKMFEITRKTKKCAQKTNFVMRIVSKNGLQFRFKFFFFSVFVLFT